MVCSIESSCIKRWEKKVRKTNTKRKKNRPVSRYSHLKNEVTHVLHSESALFFNNRIPMQVQEFDLFREQTDSSRPSYGNQNELLRSSR